MSYHQVVAIELFVLRGNVCLIIVFHSQGLLKGGSRRRKTPMGEISHSLPSNASQRKVHLSGGNGQKEQLYTQGWSNMGEPLCKLCQAPCKWVWFIFSLVGKHWMRFWLILDCRSKYSKAPQFFEDLFCNLNCFEEYRSRTSSRFLREVWIRITSVCLLFII